MSESPRPNTSAQKIAEIRLGITNQKPTAEKILKRTDPNPPQRQVINVAGQLYRQQQELKAQDEIDPMTGLLNDKGFKKKAKEEAEKAKITGRKLVVVFFDLNGLKNVNDDLGHDVGDEYIKTGAEIVSSSFRPGDIISRRGEKADEFMVALQVDNVEQVRSLYSRVNETAENANQNWEGYPILFPAGAVEVRNGEIDEAIRDADHAMYRAKTTSKEINKNVLRVQEAA